ncbi:MAG: PAS domain S-box protein [Spirochaetes bacterium]|nr:MAG: PAS domain S-box protein [Spirochaetota bacterium]
MEDEVRRASGGEPLKKLVLVVEDEAVVALDIKNRMERMGYQVPEPVSTGEDAVRCADELRPDLILMDILLEGPMDGIQAASLIGARMSVPVLFLTASNDEQTLRRSLAVNPSGYLHKPVEPATLRFTVEMALARGELESRLRESEELYRTTMENISDAVFLTDDRGAFVFICPTVHVVFGYDYGEVSGMGSIAALMGDGIKLHFPGRENGEITNLEYEITDKQGARRLLLVNIKPVAIRGATMLFTCRDVTERARSEEAMRLSEEKFQQLLDESTDPIFSFEEDGSYRYVNRAFAATVGMDSGDIIGKRIWNIFPGEEGDRRYAAVGASFRDGEVRVIEVRVPGPSGDLFFMTSVKPVRDHAGNIATVICISKDITLRKRAEDALRESEASYRTLFDTMFLGVVYQDREGRIVSVNPAAAKILGRSREELLGLTSGNAAWKSVRDDGSDFPADEHPSMAAFRSGREVLDVLMGVYNPIKKEYAWIIVNAVPQFKPGEETPFQVYTTFEDITSRRIAEKALRESEERNRSLIDANPDFMFVITAEGRIIDSNVDRLPLPGKTGTRFLGRLASEVLPPAVAQLTMEKIALVVETGEIATYDYFLDFEGPRHYEARMVPYGNKQVLAIVRDETEMVRMERMLRGERDRAQQLLDIAGVMILALDTDATVTMINRQGREILGMEENAIVGCNWIETFIPAEDRARVWDVFRRLLDGDGHRSPYGENQVLCGDGSKKLIAWHNTLVRDADGRVSGSLSSGEDITERRKAEDAIIRSLAEKEVLIKEIHHRVKNNMQVISSLLALQSHQVKDEQVKSLFRDSQNRIWAMAQVHERLYRSENLASINFHEYVTGLMRELTATYNFDPSRVLIEIGKEGNVIGVDEAVPCGLLVNELVSNAMKHAFAGGVIGTITISFSTGDSGRRRLAVRDNGRGLPDDFETRTSGSLGMRLVRALSTQLGGELSISGKGGTSVEIVFKGEGAPSP